MAATKYQNYITGDDAGAGIIYGSGETGGSWMGQTFTVSTAHRITYIKIKIYKLGSPGIIQCDLYNTVFDGYRRPTGSPLASGSYDGDTVTDSSAGEWITFTFDSGVNLAVSSVYALILKAPFGYNNGGTAGLYWRKDASSPTYSAGHTVQLLSSNGNWQYGGDAEDMMFEEWGIPIVLQEQRYAKTLVAISNNELWYGISKENMAELTAANGDIDTSEPLMAVAAYEKIFVANKTNLKVADFINIKVSTADAGLKPCTKGMTLTGGTSTATMIVDYANAVTDDSAALIYGSLTSTMGFKSGETVTGTNGDGDSVSFVTDDGSIEPPHWYNWTVFGSDTTTYGIMPSSSSLVSLYRGRLVLNDDDRPHAWYMFKVSDSWKVLYDFTNDGDLSGVSYSNNLVGEIGEGITAFIPYKDDLFIFGCTDSIWLLIGDPLGEGQLAEVTTSTGIWGARAWCIDENSILYFLGSDGLYNMPISETSAPPQNLSRVRLPNLMSDLDLDKDLHRVVLSYDPSRYGVIISKTLISDGTNINYFFSLLTNGFFPETYPNSCGVFSSHYFVHPDDTYKKFLLGCTDGYIREFDNATKNDATTSSTTAISSYCSMIYQLGENEDVNGMLRSFRSIMAGGASGGDFSDSDGVTWELHTGDDAETVLEKIKDGDTAFATGIWSTTGKQNKSRPRLKGSGMGIKLYNSTASETWAIEKLFGDVEPNKGKVR